MKRQFFPFMEESEESFHATAKAKFYVQYRHDKGMAAFSTVHEIELFHIHGRTLHSRRDRTLTGCFRHSTGQNDNGNSPIHARARTQLRQ